MYQYSTKKTKKKTDINEYENVKTISSEFDFKIRNVKIYSLLSIDMFTKRLIERLYE